MGTLPGPEAPAALQRRASPLSIHGTASWGRFLASLPGAPGGFGAGAQGAGAIGATEGVG